MRAKPELLQGCGCSDEGEALGACTQKCSELFSFLPQGGGCLRVTLAPDGGHTGGPVVCRKPGCFARRSAAVRSRVWFLWINVTRQKNMTHASKKPAAFFPREENPRVAVAGSGLGWRVEDQRSPGFLRPPVWIGKCKVWLWAAILSLLLDGVGSQGGL